MQHTKTSELKIKLQKGIEDQMKKLQMKFYDPKDKIESNIDLSTEVKQAPTFYRDYHVSHVVGSR